MVTLLLISSVLLWVIVLGNLLLTLTVIRKLTADAHGEGRSPTGLHVGEGAPAFSARTLDGQITTFADVTGNATVLVFIAPGCRPCRELLPSLADVDPPARPGKAELLLICDGTEEQTRV